MFQKYQIEKSPILNGQKKSKTSEKVQKMRDLEGPTAIRPFENTLYNEGIINHCYLGVVIGERIVLLLTTLQLHGRIHGLMITGIVGQPEQLLDCKRGLLSQRWRRLVRSIAGGKVIGMMIPHWFHFGVNHFE